MMAMQSRFGVVAVSLMAAMSMLTWPVSARAQAVHVEARAWASNVIVPQVRAMSMDAARRIEVVSVSLDISILERAATTTMDIELSNPTGSRLEAELLVPVPEGAAIKSFTFQGAAKEPTAELLPRDQVLGTYKSIVAKMKDPAMLEFAGCNLIRSSVFPVEARGGQKVRLTYEHLLDMDGGRVDYVMPRSESLDYRTPWEATVRIESKRPISTVYSSGHRFEVNRVKENCMVVKIDRQALLEPGPLMLSYLQEGEQGVTSSLFAYPDPKVGGGYFLLLAGVPAKAKGADGKGVLRELTIVLDRSGSMNGPKIEQAKAAALQIIDGLGEGETFNIIDYSDSVSSLWTSPQIKTAKTALEARKYIKEITAGGSTNLHDAIIEALRPKPAQGMLPIVLFLTDGLPTAGVTNEKSIREAAAKANEYNRRIFTFGVGFDVNAPLLTGLAQTSRGTSTFVEPNENVEAKVSKVFRGLKGPVMAQPKLATVDKDRNLEVKSRLSDLMPGDLPDLFEGDQMVVLGKYRDNEPINFRLSGEYLGKKREFYYAFNLDKATTKNSFVPRLWASRKIGALIEQIRQAGADVAANPAVGKAPTDPKMKELVDEIVSLSLEFGILTEYTAFLAKEGTDLTKKDEIIGNAKSNLEQRAQMTRTGIGAFNQAINGSVQVTQSQSNYRNSFVDEKLNKVEINSVQQVNDRALFRQNGRWIDGTAVRNNDARVDSTVTIGTPEYERLIDTLVKQHRNGSLAVRGEVLLNVDGKNVLVKNN